MHLLHPVHHLVARVRTNGSLWEYAACDPDMAVPDMDWYVISLSLVSALHPTFSAVSLTMNLTANVFLSTCCVVQDCSARGIVSVQALIPYPAGGWLHVVVTLPVVSPQCRSSLLFCHICVRCLFLAPINIACYIAQPII